MNSTELCPVCCEGHLIKSEKMVSLKKGGRVVDVVQNSHECDLCGTEIASSEDLKFNARAFRAAELHAAGRMNGFDIKVLRQRYQLTHKAAGQVFGGGPVAFCKYESHDIVPTDAMENLLWIANKYPFVVSALASRHGVEAASAPAIPDINLDLSILDGKIARDQLQSTAARRNNVYKMWEHAPIIVGNSPQASNEITLNFESAIAA